MIKKLICISLLLISTVSLPMLRSVAKLNQVIIPGVTTIHPSYGTDLKVPEVWTIEKSADSSRSSLRSEEEPKRSTVPKKAVIVAQLAEQLEYKKLLEQERAAYESARKTREIETVKQLRVVERKINENRSLYVVQSCDSNAHDENIKIQKHEMPVAPLLEKKIQEYKVKQRRYAKEKENCLNERGEAGWIPIAAVGGVFCCTAPWAGLELLFSEPEFFCGICVFFTGIAAFLTTPFTLWATANHGFAKMAEVAETCTKEEHDRAVRKLKAIKENSVAVKEKQHA